MIDDIIDFIREYYPEILPKDADLEIAEADIAELIDELDAAIPELVQLGSALKGLEELTVKPVEPIGTAKKRPGAKSDFSFGDAMEQFFKQNGLV